MDTGLDLTTASREALLAFIAQQQAVITQLQRRLQVLEGKAKPGGSPRMPGIKPKSGQGPARDKRPRKPRPHGFARQRMAPTHRVEHVLESCPQCGTGLAGGWVQRTREVIDLPLVPAQVTEHVFIARTCPVCERRRTPQADLGRVALGKHRLGVNLLSRIVPLREEGRLPLRTRAVLDHTRGSSAALTGAGSTRLTRRRTPSNSLVVSLSQSRRPGVRSGTGLLSRRRRWRRSRRRRS